MTKVKAFTLCLALALPACTTLPKPVRIKYTRPEAIAPRGKQMRVIPAQIGDENGNDDR